MNPFTAPLRLSTPARLVLALAQTLMALLFLIIFTAVASQATPPGGPHTPVTVCHNGRPLVVDDDALPAHLAHGDTAGPCTPTPTPSTTPTQEVTPWPSPTVTTTPTSSPSASPSPEPSTTGPAVPTETASPTSSPSPVAPGVTSAPSPGGTASSSSTSTSPTSEVGTVATLAATGSSLDGWIMAGFVLAAGVALVALARRRRPR